MANGMPHGPVPSLTIAQVLAVFGVLLQIILLWWGADMTGRMRAAELNEAKDRAALDICLADHAQLVEIARVAGTNTANIRHLMTLHYDLEAIVRAQSPPRRHVSEENQGGGDNPLSQRQGR